MVPRRSGVDCATEYCGKIHSTTHSASTLRGTSIDRSITLAYSLSSAAHARCFSPCLEMNLHSEVELKFCPISYYSFKLSY